MRAGMSMLLASAMLCCQAQAQMQMQEPAPAPVQPKTVNGLRYLCGGIGLDESEYIKQQAKNGGLLLTFAAKDGSYLANVHVDVTDRRGKPVLQADCDGPLMLLDLPAAGNYRIRAESGGKTLVRTASLRGKGGSEVVFVWPVAGANGSAGQEAGQRP